MDITNLHPKSLVSLQTLRTKIQDGQLSAQLLPDGTLIFHEDAIDEKAFSPAVIQATLAKAQNENKVLQELGQSMAASRQLLARVLPSA
jgi:hypothetical protein